MAIVRMLGGHHEPGTSRSLPLLKSRSAWLSIVLILLLACSSQLHSGVPSQTKVPIGGSAPAQVLTIEGRSEDGAFAVGMLKGWTARGDRPQFEIVTGIDAGALLAPFAFLGSDYDDVLGDSVPSVGRDVPIGPDELFASPEGGLTGEALAINFVNQHITENVLKAIVTEHRKGRTLLVGVSEPDSGRTVTWDLGAIAASGTLAALEKVRMAVLAAAGVPGMRPSVIGSIHRNGSGSQGARVAGGRDALHTPCAPAIPGASWKTSCRGDIHMYTIGGAGAVQGRLLAPLGSGDSEEDQDGFRRYFGYIEADFHYPAHRRFDAGYVKELCDYGYRRGIAGDAWRMSVP